MATQPGAIAAATNAGDLQAFPQRDSLERQS
jgi:hypothetical protein